MISQYQSLDGMRQAFIHFFLINHSSIVVNHSIGIGRQKCAGTGENRQREDGGISASSHPESLAADQGFCHR
jgi:hypothetical protein